MPSKLQAYLQLYKSDKNKITKLPSIYQQPTKEAKSIKTLENQIIATKNVSNLVYSKPYHKEKSIKILNNKLKPQKPSQSIQNYKKLNSIEQNIIMQIKNIDICLQSQRKQQKDKFKTSLFNGYIFLNELNQMVLDKFHQCLKIQSQASQAIVQGFQIPKFIYNSQGQTNLIQTEIVNKIKSVNKKLLDKSIDAIQSYDIKKDYEYENNCGKKWSLVKRVHTQVSRSQAHIDKDLSYSNSNINNINQSKLSFIKSYAKKNDSRSTRLFQSKFTNHSKQSFINDFSFLNKSRQTKKSNQTLLKTQPSQNQTFRQVVVNLTKRDVKLMLTKTKNIVSIWLPPASYPQFFGLFAYKIIKYQKSQFSATSNFIYKCKINRYFFYKFGIGNKMFDAILQWVIKQTNLPIQSLQITIQKSLYSKILAKMGWVLKFWQSANKVKAVYQRKIVEQKTISK